MKLADAAAVYEEVQPRLDALADDLARLRRAERVLRDYARTTGRRSYDRRIGFSVKVSRRFDSTAARQLLTAEQVEDCTREQTAVTLHLLTGDRPTPTPGA